MFYGKGWSALAEVWFTELLWGIVYSFMNPLLYWSIILVIFAGIRRIRQERNQFGIKVNDLFSEWSRTWIFSIGFGLIATAIMIGVGVELSYEMLLVLSTVTILLSIHGKLTWISASYTVGLTYMIIVFAPLLLTNQSVIPVERFEGVHLTAIALLVALFVIAESILLYTTNNKETFVQATTSARGSRIGQHHLRKIAIFPFFVLLPSGLITPIASFWPYVSLGGDTYSLLLFPFLLGYDHAVKSTMPQEAAKYIGKRMGLLGLLIFAFVAGSLFIPFLSAIAVVVAIIGRELILYRFRMREKQATPYFTPLEKGLMVLTVIPRSRADRLGIVVGDTIARVNGKEVASVTEFYYALQKSGAFFKLDILDKEGEVRFVQSAFYEGDHHELGIIFVEGREPILDEVIG